MDSRFDLPAWYRRAGWFAGSFAALASLFIGFRNALLSSKDFQWSPARLLWEGVNPYSYYLGADHPQIILTQAPVYGHLLYLLLWPYAQLTWPVAKVAWAVTNLLILAAAVALLLRQLEDPESRRRLLLAVILLCIGVAARNAISNGQQAFTILLATTLFFVYRDRPLIAGCALAVTLMKYSFGLQIAFLALVMGYWQATVVAGLVSLASVFLFSLLCGDSGLHVLFGPLIVAKSAISVGLGDIMSIARQLAGGDALSNQWALWVAAGVNLVFFACVRLFIRNMVHLDRQTVALLIGGTLYLSLGTLFHFKYDYAVLLFPLFAVILAGNLGSLMTNVFLLGNFLVFWVVPRHDSLFSGKPYGVISTATLSICFIAMAFACLYFASDRLRRLNRENDPKQRLSAGHHRDREELVRIGSHAPG